MLDSESTSVATHDLFDSPREADPSSYFASIGASDPVEGPLSDLVVAARRVVAAVRGGRGLSARARAELAQARHLLEALGAAIESSDHAIDALMVSEDGTWFQTPAGRVDVSRRGAVKRILVGLCRARGESAGKTLGVDELFEIGWPNERIPYESQVRRVYTAIWTLRTLGLEGLLLTRDEGYLLDPKRVVRVVG